MCQKTCNRCNQCMPYCQCDNTVSYDSCAPSHKCIQKMDAACVIYEMNKPNGLTELSCLNLPNGTTVKQFMLAVDRKLCQIVSGTDVFVKVDSTDTRTGYLEDKVKVEPNSCLTINKVVSEDGSKVLQIGLDYTCLCQRIRLDCNLGNCVDVDGGDLPIPIPIPIPLPVTVPIPTVIPTPVAVCISLESCDFSS